MPEALRFLLVPDRSAARSARRALASYGARCGIAAGTWAELLDQAARAHPAPPPGNDWDARLAEAAGRISDGFWSESLKADAPETLAVIGRELCRLLEALGPGKKILPAPDSGLSDRGKRHLADLARLHGLCGPPPGPPPPESDRTPPRSGRGWPRAPARSA